MTVIELYVSSSADCLKHHYFLAVIASPTQSANCLAYPLLSSRLLKSSRAPLGKVGARSPNRNVPKQLARPLTSRVMVLSFNKSCICVLYQSITVRYCRNVECRNKRQSIYWCCNSLISRQHSTAAIAADTPPMLATSRHHQNERSPGRARTEK
jgi:hypothetical protein